MIFRYPIFFALLLLLPVVLYLRYGLRSLRAAIRHPAVGRLTGIGGGLGVHLRPILPILFGVALTLIVLALARPQRMLGQERVLTEGIDIVLVIDVSPSMAALDYEENGREFNRLEAAKRVAERFIRSRKNDRIGLVAFGALPYTIAPLTLDHGWLLAQLERLREGELGNATAIGDGIATGLNRLRESPAKSRIIIALTDGVNNTGTIAPLNAALAAKALGIKVYTIGAGAEGMSRIPIQDPFGNVRYVWERSDVDVATLQRVAEITGASFFRATDMEALNRTFEEIDRMEKTEIEVEHFVRWDERFQPFLAAAILLLIAEQALGLWRLERFP
ncbi:MAG: VWA domain-containing protein [Kiritimatiellae bacterium]|nr:VWA domain-containing protein [Kiritimatiellia bacterium]MDW8459139.1 VWA domain-containing protein [Verrucomicrobiota bacterium]